eukprot:1831544-Ditylum_brightwellii.AAC.1
MEKLTDVNSAAYERLFVGNRSNNNDLVDDGDPEQKGSRLTPVKEVLRRIRWDGTLLQNDFTVQYYDRVEESIDEATFDAPNNSVSGNEDLFVFAIPEHRIVSVKYKQQIVWDKDQRVDRVFGSMKGNGETIDVVIENYADWKKEKDEQDHINRQRQAE